MPKLSDKAKEVLRTCVTLNEPIISVWSEGLMTLDDEDTFFVLEGEPENDDSLLGFGHDTFFEIGLLGVLKYGYDSSCACNCGVDKDKCAELLNSYKNNVTKCKHCREMVKSGDNGVCDDCFQERGIYCEKCDTTYTEGDIFCDHIKDDKV